MRKRSTGGRVGIAVALGAAAILVSASAGLGQATDPVVTLDRTGTAAGEKMLVGGSGWEPGGTLVVELCGRGGLGGSSDCDVPHQATAGVGTSGRFSVELTVGNPPSPCPCVVKAMDQDSRIAATAAIAVAGIPTVAITQDDAEVPTRALEVSDLTLRGGAWPELFGAGGRRWLDITLVNTGAVPITTPELSIAWGEGDHPTGFVTPPEIEAMAPGETQELTISLDRPTFALGTYTAVVEVQGVGAVPVIARTSTTGYPWGLVAIALLVLQLGLLRLRNRVRRRLAPRRTPPAAQLAPAPLALAPGTDEDLHTVIDLTAEEVQPEPVVATPVEPADRQGLDEPDAAPAAPNGAHDAMAEPLLAAVGSLAPEGPETVLDPPSDAHEQAPVTAIPAAAELALLGEAEQRLAAVEVETAAELDLARGRAAALEAAKGERLVDAEAQHEGELELLDAVWRRANDLAAASEASLVARRQAIQDEIDEARRAVTEAEEGRATRIAAAQDELAAAEAAVERASAPVDVEAEVTEPEVIAPERPPAPRIGDIDQRMARAVERALASMGRDSAN